MNRELYELSELKTKDKRRYFRKIPPKNSPNSRNSRLRKISVVLNNERDSY